jgi:hypothetical protein
VVAAQTLCVAATNNCWCCSPASLSLDKDSPRLALADQGVLKWLTRKFWWWFETPKIIQIECLNVTVRLEQLSTELSRLKDLIEKPGGFFARVEPNA